MLLGNDLAKGRFIRIAAGCAWLALDTVRLGKQPCCGLTQPELVSSTLCGFSRDRQHDQSELASFKSVRMGGQLFPGPFKDFQMCHGFFPSALAYFKRGSSASRRPSPNRLKPSTVRK